MSATDSKVAFVTGAGRGIGAAIALALAQRGITPVLAVRDPAAAASTAEQVRALGMACPIVCCEVSDEASVRRAVAEVLDTTGRLDIVVNNAATIEPIGLLGEVPPEQWVQAVAVNLSGPYFVIRAALPTFLAQGGGVILNLSSGAALGPRLGWSAYCSTKAALAMLSRSVATEYGAQGVRAYSFQPGMVDTDMQGRIRESGLNEVSRVPRSALLQPALPARIAAWLVDTAPEDLVDQELSVRDATLVARASA
jgi:NAD(P)-dependent dehydrogenase (short-subunit alcohol dehydrogenase family)